MLATAIHGRPRGFINWKPQTKTRVLIEQAQAVLEEYQKHLPLTLRQVFYRLVGAYGYSKTERDYERLCETLNKARRARLIPFGVIRDDGFHGARWQGWHTLEGAKRSLIATAEGYRIDRQRGQPVQLAAWCEAAGMAPQLERICEPYSIPVYSSGGFDSVTVKHDMAQAFARIGRVLVLHIGDHDPSGVHIFGSLDEDVRAFINEFGGDAEFIRLAVTPDHITRHSLPTAPPKETDRRNFTGETVQAEALPPDVLASILQDAISSYLDMAVYRQAIEIEQAERRVLVAWLKEKPAPHSAT
ncbi:MAG: hypothetical protein IPM89_11545 [Candidatus Competibacteraceae bacterium]|nr:MAG: hypothetical protein IPM89_11545 [Candidatus Competibacteraceae bacterium]